ncbi:MAG: signal peptidase I [Desulfobulbaceae bacterium]|nr:signal peptidase I [Desulfobulbaceae bacterium]
MSKNKPRKPWLAVLLSVLTIGLGHIYVGKAKKGILLYVGQAVIFLVLIPLIIFKTNIYFYFLLLLTGLGYLIFCAVDALKTARENKHSYELLKYNKWYLYIACYIMANMVVQPTVIHYFQENIVKAYKIPTSSMLPTIYIGDWILVNRFKYKITPPKRGDIIVFEYPQDPEIDYIKRLIAIAGDIVEIKNKKLFINNIEQTEDYAIHLDPKNINSIHSPRDNYGPLTVPNNTVFVMGDNRDKSYDSRFWGFVNVGKIRGKAISFYWSWDKDKKNVRWNRIGKSIK